MIDDWHPCDALKIAEAEYADVVTNRISTNQLVEQALKRARARLKKPELTNELKNLLIDLAKKQVLNLPRERQLEILPTRRETRIRKLITQNKPTDIISTEIAAQFGEYIKLEHVDTLLTTLDDADFDMLFAHPFWTNTRLEKLLAYINQTKPVTRDRKKATILKHLRDQQNTENIVPFIVKFIERYMSQYWGDVLTNNDPFHITKNDAGKALWLLREICKYLSKRPSKTYWKKTVRSWYYILLQQKTTEAPPWTLGRTKANQRLIKHSRDYNMLDVASTTLRRLGWVPWDFFDPKLDTQINSSVIQSIQSVNWVEGETPQITLTSQLVGTPPVYINAPAIVLWAEKEEMYTVFHELAKTHYIGYHAGGGAPSLTIKRQIYEWIKKRSKVGYVICYSDFEPHQLGLSIPLARDLQRFAHDDGLEAPSIFVFTGALTPEQITELGIEPNMFDGRPKWELASIGAYFDSDDAYERYVLRTVTENVGETSLAQVDAIESFVEMEQAKPFIGISSALENNPEDVAILEQALSDLELSLPRAESLFTDEPMVDVGQIVEDIGKKSNEIFAEPLKILNKYADEIGEPPEIAYIAPTGILEENTFAAIKPVDLSDQAAELEEYMKTTNDLQWEKADRIRDIEELRKKIPPLE